jgi:hypothetical protein
VAELVFVLADFPSVPGGAGDGGDAPAGTPRLPQLETLLARARVAPLATDWRGWLAARASSGALLPPTPAATVAAAWELRGAAGREREQVWLASPVHYFAGLDSVHLHPAGLLRLERAEQHALAVDFARVFADSPWTLRAFDRRELLLWGPAIAASGADPALYAGSDPSPGLPRGEGAGALRGLGAEIEMWLYEHPLNLERRGRGELPVTTLWLWGANTHSGATSPVRAAPPARPSRQALLARPARAARAAQLYGRDTFAEALWRLQGDTIQPLPESMDGVPIDTDADHIVLLPLGRPEGLISALQQFEQHWLPGAWRALRGRRVTRLTLLIGTRSYQLRWPQLVRFWRARRPWWEILA